jgi:NitT/TauT family transport system substrate-binding protein
VAAVTGWKKFYLVGKSGQTFSTPSILEEIAAELTQRGLPLPVSPQDSPAAGILKSMALRDGFQLTLAPMPSQQLMLEMLRGTYPYAILPEPLVSTLLAKQNNFRVLISLEEEYARRFGGEKRLPMVGIAVRTEFAARNPAFVRSFVQALQQAGMELAGNAHAAVDALPDTVVSMLGRDVLLDSLQRDMILVLPAWEARQEIEDFLRMTLPELRTPEAMEALMNAGFLLTGGQ